MALYWRMRGVENSSMGVEDSPGYYSVPAAGTSKQLYKMSEFVTLK